MKKFSLLKYREYGKVLIEFLFFFLSYECAYMSTGNSFSSFLMLLSRLCPVCLAGLRGETQDRNDI
jgi:hypothetical protein